MPSEPVTEAGKRLAHDFEHSDIRLFEVRADILAIEAEASVDTGATVDRDALERVIRALSEEDRDALFAGLDLHCPEHRRALAITAEEDWR